jgi:dTDP-4-dehydrorhamnose 3,5-epimerase
MEFRPLELEGAYEILLQPRADDRGAFSRVFCTDEFAKHGLETRYVQTNTSWNFKAGTLRGMHLQRPPHGEVKVVRCTRGAVVDVIVDLRPDSKTYKKWIGLELTEEKRNSIYVPIGFAHGYQALRDNSEVFYMVSAAYAPAHEVGYRWNDPAWNIDWPIKAPILSPKDAVHPDYQG